MNTDIKRGVLASEAHGIFKCIAIGHECSCGKDALAVGSNDARVHVMREAEVIRIDNEVAQAVFLENGEFDAQEFLWVGAEVFHQALHLGGSAIEILIKRRVDQELA